MKKMLTYEEAKSICKAYNNFNFSETIWNINGYKVSTFNYFICGYNDFENPLKDNSISAFDMRGLTFVFNVDNTLYKRFLMLPKFFNLNQVETTQYNKLKDNQIKNISIKEDGSLIAFMTLPNGEIFAKTQGGFDNEQSIRALSILNKDKRLKDTVNGLLDLEYTPLFEYVSLSNRIVLKYNNEELRFIGVRNNLTGEYLSASFLNLGINDIKTENEYSLDDLIEKAKFEKDKEGWVVEFIDGQLIKIKTDEYFQLHSLRTNNIFREDFIIENYLNNKLDDIICQLDKEKDTDAFIFIDKCVKAINNYIKYIDITTDKYLELYNLKYNNLKLFCIENHKEPFFNLSKAKIENINYNEKKISFILQKTYRLHEAKNLIEKWK